MSNGHHSYYYGYSQDIDDESVLETVDFSEFEALFQLNRNKNTMKLAKREESQFKNTHNFYLHSKLYML